MFRTYEVKYLEACDFTVTFDDVEVDLVAVPVGAQFVYYKRYDGEKFYKLSKEELQFMQLAGEEIPF